MHAELHAALTSALQFGNVGRGRQARQDIEVHGRPVDKGRGREGRGAGRDTAGSSHIEPHTQAFICPASASSRHPDKLPVALAGALVHPDDIDLPGVGAGPNREPVVGAVIEEETLNFGRF